MIVSIVALFATLLFVSFSFIILACMVSCMIDGEEDL